MHQHKTVQENFDDFKAVWPDLVRCAADHGVKIGIENWREVFGYLDGDTLGLNLDPSHLVWQMIDYERVVREFGGRIYHVHAKDMEIDRDGLYERGVMSAGMGWQVPRLPGLGEMRWDRFLAALYRAGYDHAVVVEHEDRALRGHRREGQGGVPAGPQRRRAVHRLTAVGTRSTALRRARSRSGLPLLLPGARRWR